MNKVAIVTGAGEGIGKSIASRLANQGLKVIVNDIDAKSLTLFKKETKEKNNFFFSTGDISSIEYQNRLVEQTYKKFGRINILVNNVGISSGKTFLEMDEESFQKSIESNLIAPFFLTQKVAKKMIEGKINGNIIFITSIHRKIPSGNADYSSTKRALGMLVKEFAFDLGKYGIRVNGVAPGRITDERIEDTRIPLNSQTGIPSDIAKGVTFLTDNNLSSYVTGEILTVDGGLSLDFER